MRSTDFSAGRFHLRRVLCGWVLSLAVLVSIQARGEAMLQLFNVNWDG